MDENSLIVICSYNMPEYTDSLCEHIIDKVSVPYDLVVVDNGSDKVPKSKYTTHWIEKNIQMVPGFMYGLEEADIMGKNYDYYWFLGTSGKFLKDDKRDPLKTLQKIFQIDPLAYAIQPSLLHIGEPNAWENLLSPRRPSEPRRVWATDYVCTLFKASWFDQLGRWRKEFTRGWGVGMENFYLARKAGYHIYTHDGYIMLHDTGVAYRMGRMSETYKERQTRAVKEIDKVMIPIYGKRYREKLNWSYRETGNGEY